MKRFIHYLIASAFILAAITVRAQVSIQEPDTIFLCQPGPVTLHALYTGVDSDQLVLASALQNNDDIYSGVISIGFPFDFYGNTYTQCLLSTNNYITFDLGGAGGYSPWPIGAAIPSASDPLNSIMCPWQDTYPGAGGNGGWVSYTTTGTAPNRIFIFNMCQVPMYSCTQLCYSAQCKLFETSNIIEFHIGHKDLCSSWNGGNAILGTQDATGTLATVVNNYNYPNQWTANNAAWQLVPNGANTGYNITSIPYNPIPVYSASQLQWVMNGTNMGNGDSATFTPTQSGYVNVGYSGCFGLGNGGCGSSNTTTSGADSVYIAINYFDYTQSQRVSPCNYWPDNTLRMHFPTNLHGPYHVVWQDSAGSILRSDSNVLNIDTINNISSGHYRVVVLNTIGCSDTFNYTIPLRTMGAHFNYTPNPIICQYAPVSFTDSSHGSITGYLWDFGQNASTANTQNASYNYQFPGDSILVTLTVSNDTFAACVFSDSAYVNVHPNITAEFGTQSLLCAANIIYLTDLSSPYPVSWQWYDGDSLISTTKTASFVKFFGGQYPITLIVADSLCGVDTITQSYVINDYPVVNIGNDTLLCPGESITLNAGNPGYAYQWTTGEQTQIITTTVNQTSIIGVTVDNQGCTKSDEILITMNCSLMFPNAFSPNRDGANDYFLPHLVNVKSYDLYIYNRWGQLLYSLHNGDGEPEKDGWDGTYKNVPQPEGVYVYYAKGLDIHDKPVSASGNFLLLR